MEAIGGTLRQAKTGKAPLLLPAPGAARAFVPATARHDGAPARAPGRRATVSAPFLVQLALQGDGRTEAAARRRETARLAQAAYAAAVGPDAVPVAVA